MFLIYIVNATCTLSHFVMLCRNVTKAECSALSLAMLLDITDSVHPLQIDVFALLIDAKADPNARGSIHFFEDSYVSPALLDVSD